MTEIYLIRHAQAEGNVYRIMQGHWDGGVTPAGLLQIDDLAERFRDIPVHALYTSDLYRARLTASAISRFHDVAPVCDRRLREIDVGIWERQFFGNLKHACPEQVRAFLDDPASWHVDGAETRAEVKARAMVAMREIAEQNDGRTAAVVSHGVTIRCILSEILGIGLTDMSLTICGNTGVCRLLYENGFFKADYINDDSHLSERSRAMAWRPDTELRDEPFDPRSDREYYTDCYRSGWISAHGSDVGFAPDAYFARAAVRFDADRRSLMRLYMGSSSAGLLELDTAKGVDEGYGWISLIYLSPEFRGQGLGVQALARAYTLFEAEGRHSVRLTVAEKNTNAIKFYRRWGFEIISETKGFDGALYIMEKKLGSENDV